MPIDMRDGIQVGPIDADFYGVPGRNFAGLGIGFVQENGGLSQPRPQYFRLSQQRPRTIVQGHTGYQLQPQQVRSGRITNGIRFGEFRFPFRRPLLPQTGVSPAPSTHFPSISNFPAATGAAASRSINA